MAALSVLGGEDWFQLGDRDLAVHVLRSRRLREGDALSAVTAAFAARLGIGAAIWPMSDDPVRTSVHTPDGILPFQDYFVRRRCAPVVTALSFVGAEAARPLPAVLDALDDPTLRAVVICPSNPYLSIDPILSLPGLQEALARGKAPVVAVSPLVGGAAVKGPTAKIMGELGFAISNRTICAHYGACLDGIVIDTADAADAAHLPVEVEVAPTLMADLADKVALARTVLAFADGLRRPREAA